jgi:hypothetical protein
VTIKKKEQQIPKVTIDEIEYDTEDLTENGRAQLASLQFLEGQMQNIKQEVAVYQTSGFCARAERGDREGRT